LLVGLAGLAGNLVRTGINVISAISYQVTIASLGLPFVEGLVCRTARIDATGSVIVAELAVTEAMYNAGLVTAMVSTGDDIMIGAYIYFTGGKKCSNIVFEPAFV
jgi:predicted aconitase